MAKTKVGINGFGRIGRQVFKALRRYHGDDVEIAMINELGNTSACAHLLKYDSSYGRMADDISHDDGGIIVSGEHIPVVGQANPADIDWGAKGVQVVVESTGRFTDGSKAAAHVDSGGARVVVISAPAKNVDLMAIYGINHDVFDADRHKVVSAASCTTTCTVPMVKVLHEKFGVASALLTTIHSYTADQRLIDGPHSDMRRARAAALSIIPTSTGAARAVTQIIPELKGRIDGMAFRVPTPTVSVTDLTAKLERDTSVEEVNNAYRDAANGTLKGILEYSEEPLVSADYIGSPYSCSFDAPSTLTLPDGLIKVVGWYDNEWGYASRVANLANHIGTTL